MGILLMGSACLSRLTVYEQTKGGREERGEGREGGKKGRVYVRIALPEDGDPHHPHHAGKPGEPQQVIVFQSYLQPADSDEDGEVGLPGKIGGRRAESVLVTMQVANVGDSQAFLPVLRAIRAFPGVDVSVQTRINEGAEAQGRDEEGKDHAQELEAVLRGLAGPLEGPAFQP